MYNNLLKEIDTDKNNNYNNINTETNKKIFNMISNMLDLLYSINNRYFGRNYTI